MKKIIIIISISAIAIIALAFGSSWYIKKIRNKTESIKIGIIHSLTGPTAVNETSLIDAAIFAIENLNRNGGLLGRLIEPIIVDGESSPEVCRKKAIELITKNHVVAIFGTWLSSARKEVKKVVEQYNNILFYPIPCEGLEESSNVVYIGATVNQLYLTGVRWCMEQFGKHFIIIAADEIFSLVTIEVIKQAIAYLDGKIVSEVYIPIGSINVDEAIKKITETKPNFIVNTLEGITNEAFFKNLRQAGVKPEQIPTLSFNIAEQEIIDFGAQYLAGNYAVWDYFETVNTEYNKNFVRIFKDRFGKDRVITSPMIGSYSAINIWAQAVSEAQSTNTDKVLYYIKRQTYDSPAGRMYIDYNTQYSWKAALIGKIRADGLFDIVWDSGSPIKPMPFPIYLNKAKWEEMYKKLEKHNGQNKPNNS